MPKSSLNYELQDFKEVHSKIKPYINQTPVIRSHFLEKLIPDLELYLKLEFLQPTNSFKVRGACSKVFCDENTKNSTGLVTASGGNHGLGVCYAGKQRGLPVRVFLPKSANAAKIEKIQGWGGTTEVFGEAWDDTNIRAQEFAQEEGYTYVHPFSDKWIRFGQGTISLELFDVISDLDVIVASVGGGGLITGIGMVAKLLNPDIKIYGVETVGADALTQSFRKKMIVTLPAITSIADTLGAKRTTEATFEIFEEVVDDMQTVTDQEALVALKLLLENEKILVEPATSCSVAALLQSKFRIKKNSKVGVIICGGNVCLNQLYEWGVLKK